MSNTSAIEWTESTWNPVRGCTKVSPGCANCYAETFAERWRGVKGHAYEQGFDLRLVPEKLDDPLRRKKPTTYFVNSMSDLFQEGVPDAFIDRVFAVMARAPQHTFQVLTKRPARMLAWFRRHGPVYDDASDFIALALADGDTSDIYPIEFDWPLPNVWLGVSVENQHFADERIPLLLQTPAAVRFISAEPLLEAIDIRRWLMPARCISTGVPMRRVPEKDLPGLDWVIVGGESGPGARLFDVNWARSIASQGKRAGVPVFVKQLGARPLFHDGGGRTSEGLRDRKGGDPSEWPEDLRVREFPALHLHTQELPT